MEKYYVIDCVDFFAHDLKFENILVISVPSDKFVSVGFPVHYSGGRLISRFICFDERTKDGYLNVIKSIMTQLDEIFEITYFDYNSYGANFIQGFIPQF